MIPVIICGAQGRAVVFGDVEEMPVAGQVVVIRQARMVLDWPAECGGLFGLATHGPKPGTRITSAVAEVSDTAAQVLSVSDAAALALREWPDA